MKQKHPTQKERKKLLDALREFRDQLRDINTKLDHLNVTVRECQNSLRAQEALFGW